MSTNSALTGSVLYSALNLLIPFLVVVVVSVNNNNNKSALVKERVAIS